MENQILPSSVLICSTPKSQGPRLRNSRKSDKDLTKLLYATLDVAAGAVCAGKHHRFVWVQALRLPAASIAAHFLADKCCNCHWLCFQTLICGCLAVTAGAVRTGKHRGLVWVQTLCLPAASIAAHFLANKCCNCQWLCFQTLICGCLAVTAGAVRTGKHRGLVWVQTLCLPAASIAAHFLANKCCNCQWLCFQTLICGCLAVAAGAVCTGKHRGLVWVQTLCLPAASIAAHFLPNKCCNCHWLCFQSLICGCLAVTAGAVRTGKHRGLVWVQTLCLPAASIAAHFLANKCCNCQWLCFQTLICGCLAVAAGAVCTGKHRGLVWVQALCLPAASIAAHFLANKCCNCHWLCFQTLICGCLAVAAGAVCTGKHRGLVWVQALCLPAASIAAHFLPNKCCNCHWLCFQTLICGCLAVAAGAVCTGKHRGLVWVQALCLPAASIAAHFLPNKCRNCHWLCFQSLICGCLAVAAGAVCTGKHRGLVWVQTLCLSRTGRRTG